jgi:aquaporin Z
MIGTGLLLLGGLSLVIFMFGAGSPIAELLPSKAMRMVISGFLFGSIGALIAVHRSEK